MSFLKIRFPERETYSRPKERKNTLSEIESALSRNALSRGENDFAAGRRHLSDVASGATPYGRRQVGPRGKGARLTWLLLPHARARAWPREEDTPTATAGDSGHGGGRATNPDDQGREAHPEVVSVDGKRRCRESSKARGGEAFRPPVEQGALVGERKGRGYGETWWDL